MLLEMPSCKAISDVLSKLGLCRALDKHLVSTCLTSYQTQHPEAMSEQDEQQLALWLLLASGQVAQGHICLDIAAALQTPASLLPSSQQAYGAAYEQLRRWLRDEQGSDPVSLLLRHPQLIGEEAPFVLRGQRLYLRRFARLEQLIAQRIASRMALDATLDRDALRQAIDNWFGRAPTAIDWQRQACAMAASRAFAVITGGPGTGKTTTVVRLVGVLCQLNQQHPLQIALAAPTGKAAARLSESIEQAVLKLPESQQQLLSQIPKRAQTLHRLLQRRADGEFFYHAGQPLPVDVLIIDEASMVDVELLASVMQALPAHARLILLGDKDQLASVEAGAVLAELCHQAELALYSDETLQVLAELTGQALPAPAEVGGPLQQTVVMLRESRRFAKDSGIGQLAAWVNGGDRRAVAQWVEQTQQGAGFSDLQLFVTSNLKELWPWLRAQLRQLWRDVLALQQQQLSEEAAAHAALPLLARQAQLQLLCAVRQGPWGVQQVNQQLQHYLRSMGDITTAADWYPARPVIVMENDYSTALMNGDIGLCIGYLDNDGQPLLKVAFADGQGGVRLFLPSRLPAVESAFALTVHKSQGSEYQHAMLLLPEHDSPVLTRELVYTAITRAKQQFTMLLPDPSLLLRAVERPTIRRGGLRYQPT